MLYKIVIDGQETVELIQGCVSDIDEITVGPVRCYLCLSSDEVFEVFEKSGDGEIVSAGFEICKDCAGI